MVWFGFVNNADIKRPLIPLKVKKASQELKLETIPDQVGPTVILRLTQSSCAGAGTELGNYKIFYNISRSDKRIYSELFLPWQKP